MAVPVLNFQSASSKLHDEVDSPITILGSAVRSPSIPMGQILQSVRFTKTLPDATWGGCTGDITEINSGFVSQNFSWNTQQLLPGHKRREPSKECQIFQIQGVVRDLPKEIYTQSGRSSVSGLEFNIPPDAIRLLASYEPNRMVPPDFAVHISFNEFLPLRGMVFPMFRHSPNDYHHSLPDERIPTPGNVIHIEYLLENVSEFEPSAFLNGLLETLPSFKVSTQIDGEEVIRRFFPCPTTSRFGTFVANSNMIGTTPSNAVSRYSDAVVTSNPISFRNFSFSNMSTSPGNRSGLDGAIGYAHYEPTAVSWDHYGSNYYSNGTTATATVDAVVIAPAFKDIYLSPDPAWLFDGVEWVKTAKPIFSFIGNLIPICRKKNKERHTLIEAKMEELKARETLREYLSESEYRRYITNGFIMVRGSSTGYHYQVFGDRRLRVYHKYKAIESICIHSQDCPPSDHVLNMKILIESDETEFRKLGNISKLYSNDLVDRFNNPIPQLATAHG